ncbi:MAG: hypothetical protein HRU70_09620 [Phycisphaeraceae bacterium]|nr:MAG: hypothetical protein HRU70_09620 [Phycisphaeraceae bacterium]
MKTHVMVALVASAYVAAPFSAAQQARCVSCTSTTGTHCSKVLDPSSGNWMGAMCGGIATVSWNQSVTHSFEVSCEGVGYTFSVSRDAGASCSCEAGPCEGCYLKICWPGSTLTTTVCDEPYRVFIPDGNYVCGMPMGEWETRWRRVVRHSFKSGGRAACAKQVDQSAETACACKQLGHDCPCESSPSEHKAEASNEGSHALFSAMSMGVSQFRDEYPLFGDLTSIGSATLRQRIEVRDAVLSGIERFGYVPDSITVWFGDGRAHGGETAEMLEWLDSLVADARLDDARYDLDGDGLISDHDVKMFDLLMEWQDDSGIEFSRLDFNGSLHANAEDRCDLVGMIGVIVEH